MARRKDATDDQMFTRFLVVCKGLADMMFDRYIDNKDHGPAEKMYLVAGERATMPLVFPAENVRSFLGAKRSDTISCAGFFGKKAKRTESMMILACLQISPEAIPLTRNGEPVIFERFDPKGAEGDGALYVHTAIGREGTPHVVRRPVLRLPWEMQFQITLLRNDYVRGTDVRKYFEQGGPLIGFGAYRPRFGRFSAEVSRI